VINCSLPSRRLPAVFISLWLGTRVWKGRHTRTWTNIDRYLFIFMSGLVEERPLLAWLAGPQPGSAAGGRSCSPSPALEVSSWVAGVCQGKLRSNLSRFPSFFKKSSVEGVTQLRLLANESVTVLGVVKRGSTLPFGGGEPWPLKRGRELEAYWSWRTRQQGVFIHPGDFSCLLFSFWSSSELVVWHCHEGGFRDHLSWVGAV